MDIEVRKELSILQAAGSWRCWLGWTHVFNPSLCTSHTHTSARGGEGGGACHHDDYEQHCSLLRGTALKNTQHPASVFVTISPT